MLHVSYVNGGDNNDQACYWLDIISVLALLPDLPTFPDLPVIFSIFDSLDTINDYNAKSSHFLIFNICPFLLWNYY